MHQSSPTRILDPRNRVRVSTFLVVAAFVTSVSAAPANAAPETVTASTTADEPTARSVKIDGAVIRANAITPDGLAKQLKSKRGLALTIAQREQRRVAEHLDAAAREGRLVDESTLRISSVSDPLVPGKFLQFVWEGDKAPQSVSYHRLDTGEGSDDVAALGIELGGEPAGGAKKLTPSSTAATGAGSGFGYGYDVKRMRKAHNLCTDVWFDAALDNTRDHKMTSCYEDWEQDGTKHFIYNRWTLWTPALGTGAYDYATTDFYIASRPWVGKTGNFSKLNGWQPQKKYEECTDVGEATLSGVYSGLTGSVSFPMHRCDEYTPDVTASKFKIGMQFYGSITPGFQTKGQMGMDVAGDYDAINATVALVWADYNWVEVVGCVAVACTGAPEKWVKKDSGW